MGTWASAPAVRTPIEQVKVTGLAIKAKDGGHFISIDQIDAGASWVSVLRLVPVIDHLSVSGPKISVARLDANRYDFSDIVERILAKPKSNSTAPVAFVLNQFSIERGALDFDDRPEKTRHQVRDLRLVVPFVSSVPRDAAVPVQPVLTLSANGMALDLSGQITPFNDPLGASLKFDFKNLDITRYVEYVPFPLGFKLASGVLAGELSVDLSNNKDKGTVLSGKGRISLDKLDLRELSDAPLLSIANLHLEIAALDPFARSVALQSLSVDGLDVRARRQTGGWNLDALKPRQQADRNEAQAAEAPSATGNAASFSLADFALKNGRIEFSDEVVAPPFQTVLQGISVSAKDLGNAPGKIADVNIGFETRAGESLRAQAKVGLAPFTANASLTLDRIGLAAYAPYFSPYLNAELEGMLSLTGTVQVVADASETRLNAESIGLRLAGLRVSQSKADVLRMANVDINVAQVDPGKRVVSGIEITLKDGSLALRRDERGILSVMQLLAPRGGTAEPAAPPVDEKTLAAEKTTWTIDLKRASLERFALAFEDAATNPPVRLEFNPIALLAESLSTRPGTLGRVSARMGLNQNGTLELAGQAGIAPLSAKLSLNASNLGIVPLQPYFARFINALVTSGGVSANGELSLQSAPEGLSVTYSGGAGVSEFALVDASADQPLFNFKSLNLEQIQVQTLPLGVNIGQVALSDFYSRVVVRPDGKLNLQNIAAVSKEPVTTNAANAGTPDNAAAAPGGNSGNPVKIGRVTMLGGTVEFSDQTITPTFSARLTDIGGRVSGLSGEPGTRADVELKGRVDGVAPLDINGSVNPLAGNLFLDIKASAQGIDLNPMTPYAAKYVGYGIEKGKLSVDLGYKIENGKIEAQNRIFLDQLTFGEPVESPNAIKLPVLLAVALLKNSRGEIDINLPIGGSLQDPEFSIGGIIWKLVGNLILKAVTAPFAILGSMFGGGGEEMAYIEFEPGLAALVAAQETKLQNLAKALTERSTLRLEMAGRVEAVSDREGLKREMLMQKVRAQKVASTVGQGGDVKSPGAVQVSPAEYPDMLKRAYDRETFANPRNLIGLARALPVEEMEKLILTHIEIGEQQLRDLARQREEAVRGWLLKSGNIGAARMFLVEARDDSADQESRAKARANRVDLYIK